MCVFVCLCWLYKSLIHVAHSDRKNSCPSVTAVCLCVCLCGRVRERNWPSVSWLYLLCRDMVHRYSSVISGISSEAGERRLLNIATIALWTVSPPFLRAEEETLTYLLRFLTVPIVCWNASKCPWNGCSANTNHTFPNFSTENIWELTAVK